MTIATLPDIVTTHARERGGNTALIYDDDGRRWTFRELDRDANRTAHALAAANVGPGDRIAYLDKNTPEYFLFLFGGAKLGAVSVAVNWRLAPPEMEYILNNSEAKVLLVGEEFLGHLARMSLDHVRKVVVIGDPGNTDFEAFDRWVAPHGDGEPGYSPAPEETCYQLYTSGTTGLPKGVELSHANFIHAMGQGLGPIGMTESSTNLVCMPLFHIAGSGWGVVGMYGGARTVLLRDVDLPQILRVVPEHRITHTIFVPAVLQFLLGLPETRQTDFTSLESITYGASPITESVLVDAMRTFGCRFWQAYGLTETTGAVSLLYPDDHDPGGERAYLLRSCGKPVANHTLRIVDPETGADKPDGEVGEIWVQGPQNMKGYWKNPEATSDTLLSGGWLRTGDAGYLRDGYLYIHDRVKDMIVSGGENIYPAEVENVLMQHPQISDAAVIGVPSERWGETVKAVVTRADAGLTEQAVIEFCRERLAHYKCPTSVDWMETIPRNPSGKILKTELREPYWKGRDRRVG